MVIGVSFLVLLLWIPLRQRPGIGTLCNAVLVGVFADVGLALIPQFSHLGGQIALLVGAVLLNGVASACYIGARLGPGARDGLMTGLARRTGWPVRGVADRDRGGGAGRGLAAGRLGRRRDGALCAGDRSAGAAPAAAVHRAGEFGLEDRDGDSDTWFMDGVQYRRKTGGGTRRADGRTLTQEALSSPVRRRQPGSGPQWPLPGTAAAGTAPVTVRTGATGA